MRFVLLGIAAVALGACNAQDAKDIAQDAGKLGKTTARAATNAQLAARVNSVLVQRKGVDMSGLHIEAKGGVVTVGGTVRDAAERRRVIDTVEGTRGVEKVVDNLRIKK